MLGLKLPTDPRWVNIVEKNIGEILTDHAFCEQKATSTAISLIVSFPEYTELVQEMIELVKEEMSHFKMVHDIILERGYNLGRDRKDDYVVDGKVKRQPFKGKKTSEDTSSKDPLNGKVYQHVVVVSKEAFQNGAIEAHWMKES